ncbi:MAG: IPTL-CTERM sorting domain-containing protein [Betaproteobacteria bacterium]
MTTIKAAMVASGRRVEGDGAITDATLKSASVYIFGEPTATPTASELMALRQFVNNGGIVLIFGDTGIDLPTYNNLLAGIGSTITFIPTTIGTTSALADGQFTQGPSKISGSSLSVTSGNGTAGGTLIDNNYVRYEPIGAGYVFVFGDRIDHNDVISDTNTKLLLNVVSVAAEFPFQIPTLSPAGLLLLALLLAGAGAAPLLRRRR